MADPRQQARDEMDKATTSLIEAEERYLKDVPVNKIITAGLSNQQNLIEMLATVVISNNLVPEGDKDDFNNTLQQNKDLVESIQLQTLYASKEDSGLESYTDPEALIVPIYDLGDPPLVTSVSDTQVKNISSLSCEDHVGPNLDLHVETFLSTVFTVAKQLNLSHKCCSDVIQRKLTKTAKTIFESWLASNNINGAQVELHVLCHFLERTFCLYSSPRAVNIQLTNLEKIKNAQYLQAIGKISKLCRLSVRNIKDKTQRDMIEESKAIEAFRSVCNDTDKAFLVAEDRIRAEQHKKPLTIHKAGQLLAQRYADSVQNTLANSEEPLSSNRVPFSEDDIYQEEFETLQANYVPGRGNYAPGRGNYVPGRANYVPGRGQGAARQPNYQPRPGYQPRFPSFNNQRYQTTPPGNYLRPSHQRPPYNRPGFSPNPSPRNYQPRNYQPGRGGGTPNYNRFPNSSRGRGRGVPPRNQYPNYTKRDPNLQTRYGPERRPNITPDSLGMPPNVCLFCGDPNHRYYDQSCKYFGRSQLQTTNCRHCLAHGLKRGHSHRSCLEPKIGNAYIAEQDEDISIQTFLDHFDDTKNVN